jgi:hypothetical protein
MATIDLRDANENRNPKAYPDQAPPRLFAGTRGFITRGFRQATLLGDARVLAGQDPALVHRQRRGGASAGPIVKEGIAGDGENESDA